MRIWHVKFFGSRVIFWNNAPQFFSFFFKQGLTSAGRNSALKTPYPPLPYIFWKLWTCSFTWNHPIYDIPIQKIDGDAIPRPQKTMILRVRNLDYIVKSAIFKVWVISETSMHEITLYAIDMQFFNTLEPIWKSDLHSPPDSTTSETASYPDEE